MDQNQGTNTCQYMSIYCRQEGGLCLGDRAFQRSGDAQDKITKRVSSFYN